MRIQFLAYAERLDGPLWIMQLARADGVAVGLAEKEYFAFNDEELGKALCKLGSTERPLFAYEKYFLNALGGAFSGTDRVWKTSAKRRGKAPVTTIQQIESRTIRDAAIAAHLIDCLQEGVKFEAALAQVSASSGLKRASLFRIWKQKHTTAGNFFVNWNAVDSHEPDGPSFFRRYIRWLRTLLR